MTEALSLAGTFVNMIHSPVLWAKKEENLPMLQKLYNKKLHC